MPTRSQYSDLRPLPPLPWALIADDLTGACDAAAPFAEHGFPATVLLSHDPAEIARAGLTAISTESRDIEPDVAAERVAGVCKWLVENGVHLVYKKIDSVLRGNISAEVAAALDSTASPRALLTPAFPQMGRLVSGGKLTVPSQPGFEPVNLSQSFSDNSAIQIADASTAADLAAIVEKAFRSGPHPLLAGSAGLATALAPYLAARLHPQPPRQERLACDALLYFIGTPHAATAAQLDYLVGRRAAVARQLEGLQLDSAARESNCLIVRAAWRNPAPEQCSLLLDWLQAHPRAGLVLSGGDTAAFFCAAAGVRAIELGGEAFPGIPWGILRGGPADRCLVVTKSGGFGPQRMLLDIDGFLRNGSQRS